MHSQLDRQIQQLLFSFTFTLCKSTTQPVYILPLSYSLQNSSTIMLGVILFFLFIGLDIWHAFSKVFVQTHLIFFCTTLSRESTTFLGLNMEWRGLVFEAVLYRTKAEIFPFSLLLLSFILPHQIINILKWESVGRAFSVVLVLTVMVTWTENFQHNHLREPWVTYSLMAILV